MWWQRKSNQLAITYVLGSLALAFGIIFLEKVYYLLPIIFAISYLFIRKKLYWLAVMGGLIIFCLWRGAAAWPNIGSGTIYNNNGYGKYFGIVINEPTIKVDKSLVVVSLTKVIKNNIEEKIVGKIQIETNRFIEINPGDEISFSCKVVPAKNLDGSWQMWLVKDQIIAKCSNTLITKVGKISTIKFWSLNKLLWLKQRATKVTNNILPEPFSSLLAGILWGARAGLPDNLQQTMKAAGITHIIAISGFNISLITVALGSWLIAIGLSRKSAATVIGLVLIMFVVITGASASVVRAAVMGGFVVVIRMVQRKARAIVVLPLALLLMSVFSPLALLYDAGLHLSFLATVGLMVVNPQIEKLLPGNFPTTLKESMVTTISATLMTGPYCWWQFGQLTLAGLVSNLVVVPLVPWVMAVGAIAVSFGFVSQTLALPWAFVTKVLLAIILWIAQLASNIPSL